MQMENSMRSAVRLSKLHIHAYLDGNKIQQSPENIVIVWTLVATFCNYFFNHDAHLNILVIKQR